MATTTTDTRAETRAPIDPDGAHYVIKASIRAATEMGVEVQTLCGMWDFLDMLEDESGEGAALGICPRCEQIHASLP